MAKRVRELREKYQGKQKKSETSPFAASPFAQDANEDFEDILV